MRRAIVICIAALALTVCVAAAMMAASSSPLVCTPGSGGGVACR
jgi:hypothetical protein